MPPCLICVAFPSPFVSFTFFIPKHFLSILPSALKQPWKQKQSKSKAATDCTAIACPPVIKPRGPRPQDKSSSPPSPSLSPHSFPKLPFPTPRPQQLAPWSSSCLVARSPLASSSPSPPRPSLSLNHTSPRHSGFLDCWRRAMLHGGRPLSLRGSLKALEADIHHANTL